MIIKSFELSKVDHKNKFFLFYGENQGFKNQVIDEKFKKKYSDCTYSYEESEIFNNKENFFNNILSKSFFEKEKLIIINRSTDKIKDVIEEIIEKEVADFYLKKIKIQFVSHFMRTMIKHYLEWLIFFLEREKFRFLNN